jgi:hypothetical protein
MKPVSFRGQNCVYAKGQPGYLPLPSFRDSEGDVVSCWKLSWWELLRLVFTRRVWLLQRTFLHPLQPQLPQVNSPFKKP